MLTIPVLHATADTASGENYCSWQQSGYEINQPLCGLRGDSQRGSKLVTDAHGGNCIACHELPLPAEAHGDIGPPLDGVASRLSEGHIRLRVVNSHLISPMTIMPAYTRTRNRSTDPERNTAAKPS
jgi:sulfur-oxidizing protein SoxX